MLSAAFARNEKPKFPDDPFPRKVTRAVSLTGLVVGAGPTGPAEFNVFYGGVGDFRHPIATLASIGRQLDELSEAAADRVRVRLVVNDIDSCILARGWVMLGMLGEYGNAVAAGDDEGELLWRRQLFETYLSPIVDEFGFDDIKAIVERGVPDATTAEWGGSCGNGATRDAITQVFDDWLTTEYTAEDMYAYVKPKSSAASLGANCSATGISATALEDDATDRAERMVEQMRTEYAALDEEGVRNKARACLPAGRDPPPNLDPEHPDWRVLRTNMIEYFARAMADFDAVADEHLLEGPSMLHVDPDVYSMASHAFDSCHTIFADGVIPFPTLEDGEAYDAFMEHCGVIKASGAGPGSGLTTLFREHVLPDLKPNLTFCFPDLGYVVSSSASSNGQLECPFSVMQQLLGGSDALGPARNAREAAATEAGTSVPPHAKTLDEPLEPFFRDAARAIHFLAARGNLAVDFYHGDMLDVAAELRRAEVEVGVRVGDQALRFSRVLLSNVPDYTGLLPALLRFVPLLSEVDGLLLHNCLLNCSVWGATDSAIDEYVYSTTKVPDLGLMAPLLGAKFVSGGIWGSTFIAWERAVGEPCAAASGEHVTQQQFTDWLHDLFVSIVQPAPRTQSPCVEICPMTLEVFFELVHWLAADRSGPAVPRHWLAEVLQPIFDDNLHTAARAPLLSPAAPSRSPILVPGAKLKFDTDVYRPELNRLWNAWAPSLPFRIPMDTDFPRGPSVKLTAWFEPAEPTESASAGPFGMWAPRDNSHPVAGCGIIASTEMVSLHRLRRDAFDQGSDAGPLAGLAQMMAAMKLPGMPGTPGMQRGKSVSEVLAKARLAGPQRLVPTLFSGFEWSHEDGRLSVELPHWCYQRWLKVCPNLALWVYRTDCPENAAYVHVPMVASLMDCGRLAEPGKPGSMEVTFTGSEEQLIRDVRREGDPLPVHERGPGPAGKAYSGARQRDRKPAASGGPSDATSAPRAPRAPRISPGLSRPTLRFGPGDRVLCAYEGWTAGTVVQQWYRESDFEPGEVAAYQVELDNGALIFAPCDVDDCVRRLPT